MCSWKKYGIIACLFIIGIYFGLRWFAYSSPEEYVKKDMPIILFEHNNKHYVSITTSSIGGKKYETFYAYDNGVPVTLNLIKENVKYTKSDTITKIYMEYVSQYKKKSKLKPLFKDKYFDMDTGEIYAIVHIPNHYVVN